MAQTEGAASLMDTAVSALPPELGTVVKNDPMARQFYGLLGPQLAELEQALGSQISVLDEMNQKWKEEQEASKKKLQQKHVPQPLRNSGQSLTQISQKISGLFQYSNFSEKCPEKEEKPESAMEAISSAIEEYQRDLKKLKPPGSTEDDAEAESDEKQAEPEVVDEEFTDETLKPVILPDMTDLDRVLLLSHSLAAYATLLPQDHRERFYTRIINDTNHWLTSLFRIKDCTGLYHDETTEGAINMARIALASKYPSYLEEGFDCLYSRPPVIYISSASPPDLARKLSRGLGLPSSCICRVPYKTEQGHLHKMDVDAFESLVNDHIACTKEPVMVIAYASTPQIAAVDPLQKLKTICNDKNIWLHVEGLNLATLIMMTVPTALVPVRTSDSCTLNMSCWFGFPGCPSVSFYKSECMETAHNLNLIGESRNLRLKCLPLWVSLQAVGVDGMVERVKTSVEMTSILLKGLSEIPTITILNKKPRDEKSSSEITSIGGLLSKLVSTFLIFDLATPVVVFTYGHSRNDPPAEVAPYAPAEDTAASTADKDSLDKYYQSLNRWFIETAKIECPNIYIETVQLDGVGTAIKFSPLEHAFTTGTTTQHIEDFLNFTRNKVSIMNATVSHRQSFIQVVEDQDNLRFIDLPNWGGIGAVQYIPTEWLDKLSELPPQGRSDINKINIELVHQLKANDAAFSLGKSPDGMSCSRFGLITQDTDMEELIGLVYATGKEIEESSKFVEQMAEMVKIGIEKANQDLEKENETRLLQEGVLRQVPLVSSLMNWWSPPPKEVTNLKGRAFSLASGTIKSTEDTYKHHMQIVEPIEEKPSRPQQPLKSMLKKTRLSYDGSNGAPQSPTHSVESLEIPPAQPSSMGTSPTTTTTETSSDTTTTDESRSSSSASQDAVTSSESGQSISTGEEPNSELPPGSNPST